MTRPALRVTWVQPEDLVRHELWQAAQEGRDVEAVRARWAVAWDGPLDPPYVGASPDVAGPAQRALAEELLTELDALPDPGADREPSDWPAIRDAIAATAPTRAASPADLDRLHAAWLGRAVGCVLGKPVEKVPREGIEAILRSTGRWPLDRWFTAVGLAPDVAERWPWNRASRTTSLEENLDGTPEDDDINYTLMALRVLEQHGAGFTPDDVANGWLLDLPAGRAFTAERVAYRNLLEGLTPPDTARVRNPFREWIGAQIRTDLYGWVSAGDPLRAAEWAWRDASVSHTRNGLYGAMFTAAMGSEAVRGSDIDTVLDVGASVIPPRSRMAGAVALGRDLAASTSDPTEAYVALEREYTGHHWVHVLNNAALVAYALAASGGDFDRAVSLTVMGGWDTDSNGATVGGIAGALGGTSAITARWSEPLRGRVSSSLPGADGATFTELAERTHAVATGARP
ncbi:ADP-ribosylglycohydrolase family protein [Phycicoccus avicenniae]|uniref:ADP-ribosylglycohydrolase family protein n=1 Tax=Phycicoccus avicenniae TaxID=2828860 RepID=UPI003D27364A